jgi:hypothetical protein
LRRVWASANGLTLSVLDGSHDSARSGAIWRSLRLSYSQSVVWARKASIDHFPNRQFDWMSLFDHIHPVCIWKVMNFWLRKNQPHNYHNASYAIKQLSIRNYRKFQ